MPSYQNFINIANEGEGYVLSPSVSRRTPKVINLFFHNTGFERSPPEYLHPVHWWLDSAVSIMEPFDLSCIFFVVCPKFALPCFMFVLFCLWEQYATKKHGVHWPKATVFLLLWAKVVWLFPLKTLCSEFEFQSHQNTAVNSSEPCNNRPL